MPTAIKQDRAPVVWQWHTEPPPANDSDVFVLSDDGHMETWRSSWARAQWRDGWRWLPLPKARRLLGLEA